MIRNAVLALRARDTAAVVGASGPGTVLDLDALDLLQNSKIVRGVIEGDSVPDVLIARLVDLYLAGHFPFDKLAKFYPFDQINEEAEDSEKV